MSVTPSNHHPLLAAITPWAGPDPDGYFIDFLGIKTRRAFVEGLLHDSVAKGAPIAGGMSDAIPSYALDPNAAVSPDDARPLPAFDEQYFEWVDIAESLASATDTYLLVELGAGYGRWCVRAVELAKRLNPVPVVVVAVEPEPTHFKWICLHLADNGIDPRAHRLIRAAVSNRRGRVTFAAGDAGGWYGQAIVEVPAWWPRFEEQTRYLAKRALGLTPRRPRPIKVKTEQARARAVIRVRAITLDEVLADVTHVDLLNLDIQGTEVSVLTSAVTTLDRKVKRVRIGTHSHDIERRLRDLFAGLRWDCLRDYALGSTADTPYGRIRFDDGVQSWVNPTL